MSKIVVVGDVAVGKTSLVNRFCRNNFDRDYKATIGVDFEVEQLVILGVPHKLQFWDTAGQERFRSLASAYYRGADAVIVVFDVSEKDSLQHAEQWMEDACGASGSQQPLRFLVGNKTDLVADSKLEAMKSEAAEVANRIQAELWHASARTGELVNEFFMRAGALSFEQKFLQLLEFGAQCSQQCDDAIPREILPTQPTIKLSSGKSSNETNALSSKCTSCLS